MEPSGFTKISALGVEEQRVNVLLDFAEPHSRWASVADGFRVIAHIVIWQSENALQVPISAMFRSGTGWAVFVVRDGRARLTPVRTGHANDETAEVLAGLKRDEQVIVHPSDRVRNGVRVEARSPSGYR